MVEKEKKMSLLDVLMSENTERLPTFNELKKILLAVCPYGQIQWDNNNQIIFCTGLTDKEDGTLREIE